MKPRSILIKDKVEIKPYEQPKFYFPNQPGEITAINEFFGIEYQYNKNDIDIYLAPVAAIGNGFGVFANSDIYCKQLGKYVGIEKKLAPDDDCPYAFDLDKEDDSVLDAQSVRNWTGFANHSGYPNCRFEILKNKREIHFLKDDNIFFLPKYHQLFIHYGDNYFTKARSHITPVYLHPTDDWRPPSQRVLDAHKYYAPESLVLDADIAKALGYETSQQFIATMLFEAVYKQDEDAVNAILADEDKNHLEQLTYAIEESTEVHPPFTHQISVIAKQQNTTPVMLACLLGNINIITALIKEGADIQRHTLHNNLNVVNFLIENEQLDSATRTSTMTTLIQKYSARILHKDNQGRTILHHACIKNRINCIKSLLKIVDDNAKDFYLRELISTNETTVATALQKLGQNENCEITRTLRATFKAVKPKLIWEILLDEMIDLEIINSDMHDLEKFLNIINGLETVYPANNWWRVLTGFISKEKKREEEGLWGELKKLSPMFLKPIMESFLKHACFKTSIFGEEAQEILDALKAKDAQTINGETDRIRNESNSNTLEDCSNESATTIAKTNLIINTSSEIKTMTTITNEMVEKQIREASDQYLLKVGGKDVDRSYIIETIEGNTVRYPKYQLIILPPSECTSKQETDDFCKKVMNKLISYQNKNILYIIGKWQEKNSYQCKIKGEDCTVTIINPKTAIEGSVIISRTTAMTVAKDYKSSPNAATVASTTKDPRPECAITPCTATHAPLNDGAISVLERQQQPPQPEISEVPLFTSNNNNIGGIGIISEQVSEHNIPQETPMQINSPFSDSELSEDESDDELILMYGNLASMTQKRKTIEAENKDILSQIEALKVQKELEKSKAKAAKRSKLEEAINKERTTITILEAKKFTLFTDKRSLNHEVEKYKKKCEKYTKPQGKS